LILALKKCVKNRHLAPKATFEQDFLLQIGMNAVPVEVKAETNVRSQSLKAFYDKFHPEKSIRFSLLPYKDQDWMVNIPISAIFVKSIDQFNI
jgi:hypothetical protein